MRKIRATLNKELLLLFRDREGVLLLFLMPMILIVVMALIQHAPFQEYQERSIPMLYVDKDNDSLGTALETNIKRSKAFDLERPFKGKDPTMERIKASIRRGTYKVALVTGRGSSDKLDSLAKGNVRKLLGVGSDSSTASQKGKVPLFLYFDPVTKPTFKSSVRHFVDRFLADHGATVLMRSLGEELRKRFPNGDLGKVGGDREKLFQVQEEPAGDGDELPQLSSVQHNVPAWTVFGIFFIVVTMAGNMIRERNDGSAFRMKTLPNATLPTIIGKVNAYLLVSILQCALMLLVGIFVLPLFGLPAFDPGNNVFGILLVSGVTGFAATGFGVFVGSTFSTQQQSSGFSAVSIVLLAAIGGIWVPLYVMPDAMKEIGKASPLHWGLDAFNAIFIRNSGLKGAASGLVKLFMTGVLMMAAAHFVEERRTP